MILAKLMTLKLDAAWQPLEVITAERGFSIKKSGPLDMRMSKAGISAAHVVNFFKEKEVIGEITSPFVKVYTSINVIDAIFD